MPVHVQLFVVNGHFCYKNGSQVLQEYELRLVITAKKYKISVKSNKNVDK